MASAYDYQTYKDLAKQGVIGSLFYIFIWLIILSVTPFYNDWKHLSVGVAVLLTLLGGIRSGVGYYFEQIFAYSKNFWFATYTVCLLGLAMTWGLVTAFVVWFYTPQWDASFMGLCTAGIVAGGTITLSCHRKLQRIYILVMLLPSVFVCFSLNNPQAYGLGFLFLLNTFYLLGMGNHLYKQYRRLRDLGDLDGLTGIPNRRHFDNLLEQELKRASRGHSPLSLMLVDIDCFKKYNDGYGHLQGDQCLKAVARTLVSSMRRSHDVAARFGGEEFACILPGGTAEEVQLIANRLLTTMARKKIEHRYSDIADYLTLSIGAATLTPCYPITPEEVIKRVDELLYQSKREGRNRFTHVSLDSHQQRACSDKLSA